MRILRELVICPRTYMSVQSIWKLLETGEVITVIKRINIIHSRFKSIFSDIVSIVTVDVHLLRIQIYC
jgi:hypothetical protein